MQPAQGEQSRAREKGQEGPKRREEAGEEEGEALQIEREERAAEEEEEVPRVLQEPLRTRTPAGGGRAAGAEAAEGAR